jgi:hypothetical protein
VKPTDPDTMLDVDLERGFYEHFAPEFRAYYGRDSRFVRASADLLTARTAELLRKNNQLNPRVRPAVRADDASRASLDRLVQRIEGSKFLWREALGRAPIGTLAQHADGALGRAVFERWLAAFERADYVGSDALCGPPPDADATP